MARMVGPPPAPPAAKKFLFNRLLFLPENRLASLDISGGQILLL